MRNTVSRAEASKCVMGGVLLVVLEAPVRKGGKKKERAGQDQGS